MLPILSRVLAARLNHFLVLVLEHVSFVGLLLTFSVLVMHLPTTSPWALYAIGLVLLLVGGAELVREYKERTLNYLADSPAGGHEILLTEGSHELRELPGQGIRTGIDGIRPRFKGRNLLIHRSSSRRCDLAIQSRISKGTYPSVEWPVSQHFSVA